MMEMLLLQNEKLQEHLEVADEAANSSSNDGTVLKQLLNADSKWVKFSLGERACYQNTGIKGLNSLKMPREGVKGERQIKHDDAIGRQKFETNYEKAGKMDGMKARARAADEKRVPVGAPAAFGPSAASRADAARREARRAVVERGVRVRERPRGAQALRVAVGGKVARGSEPRAGTRRARAAERPVILRANLAEAREHADALRAQGHEHDQGADADGAGPRVLFVDVDARVVPVRDGLKGRDGAAGRKVEHVRRLVHARDEHQPPVEALQHAVVVGPGRGEARLVRQREGGGIQD